jgi:5-methyltetrahydrofolate--homocysteine methyltransferase
MNERGVPSTAGDRQTAAQQIVAFIDKYRIDRERLYIDAVVQPVATDSRQGIEFLNAVRIIKSSLGVKTIAGLSNVSFGLPNRAGLNASFLAMAIAFGLDAGIIDITNPDIYTALKAAGALVGQDQFCQDYISAYRSGRLG